jgi:diguanylate cyclase (GGDEF)-like protein
MPGQERIDADILLVEDDRALALMAAKMLHERWGCRVLIATTLAQVQTIIAQGQRHFFLAVSDLNLPDAANGEVIDALLAAGLPTIAVTGSFDRGLLDRIMGKGVIDYVLKNSINAYEYIVELVGRLYRNTHIKALVIDDDEGFRLLLRHMLGLQRLQVVTASGGQEALALLERDDDIKLVLVDYLMAQMDGIRFVAEARRRLSKDRLAVIGISGVEDPTVAAQFLKQGANDFIAKPFTYEELVCRISHNLQMLESIEAVRYIAYHDYLTGQLNRRAFFEEGGKRHAQALKEGDAAAVAMLDIDFFKKINDTHSHDAGDAVLRHFSTLLDAYFGGELVGRLGGEEFALLVADGAQAAARCEAFCRAVAQSPAMFDDQPIPFTVSIGLSRRLQADLEASLRLADEQLYLAKQQGRNRVIVA